MVANTIECSLAVNQTQIYTLISCRSKGTRRDIGIYMNSRQQLESVLKYLNKQINIDLCMSISALVLDEPIGSCL
jgi:hypothetical protein